MPWKKKPDSLGVGKGDLWMWIRKVSLKNPEGKAVTVNVTKGNKIEGSGLKMKWDRIGTIWLNKEDITQLKLELEEILRTW
jgi:hypothetical protein